MLKRLRQLFCHHKWRPTRFQALVGPTSFECVKCGKIDYADNLKSKAERK